MVALVILAITLAWLAPLIVIAMRGTKRGDDITEEPGHDELLRIALDLG